MDLQHEVVLAFLEEDNARNGYFRAFPLLTPSGPVQREALASWPDEGALRIIPDRGERTTFKDRMRRQGAWCIIDVTRFDPGSNKIRSNKNYHPDRGEDNQFIIFSDAVLPVGPAPFAEVLEGLPEDAAQMAARSITPRFFIRGGDTWYGPVSRDEPAVPGPAAPMEAELFTLTDPRGGEHTVLCLPEAEAQALPIGQKLEILDQRRSFEETVTALSQPLSETANLISGAPAQMSMPETPAPKLSGTPLVRTTVRTSEPMLRNRVQQMASGKVQSMHSAEPPAPPVPFSTDLPTVPNLAEQAERAFGAAWTDTAVRPRLAKYVLSLEGMKMALDHAIYSHPNTRLASALQYHLRELEAERLRILIELDHAKEDMAAFRTQAIESASQKMRRELDSLRRERDELAAAVDQLRGEADRLLTQCSDAGVRIGLSISGQEALRRLESAFDTENLPYHREKAAVWMALMSRSGASAAIVTDDVEAAAGFAERHAALLGWPCSTVEKAPPLPGTAVATPIVRLSVSPQTQAAPGERVIVAVSDADAIRETDLPIVPVTNARFDMPAAPERPLVPPESLEAVLKEAPFSPEETAAVLRPVFEAAGLPESLLEPASTFASIASGLLSGGLAAACDWAVVLWVMPRLTDDARRGAILPLLDEYPRARSLA